MQLNGHRIKSKVAGEKIETSSTPYFSTFHMKRDSKAFAPFMQCILFSIKEDHSPASFKKVDKVRMLFYSDSVPIIINNLHNHILDMILHFGLINILSPNKTFRFHH